MKTNLFNKAAPPAILYICRDRLLLNLCQNGENHISLKSNYDDFENLPASLLNEITKVVTSGARLELVVIVAEDLLLYSQQTLPANMSGNEICEFLALQQSQRQADSGVQTYYDYFILKQSSDSVVLAMFEARKDTLTTLLREFENHGFVVALVIPQLLVIINRLLADGQIETESSHLICNLNRTVFIAELKNHKLAGLHQIHVDQTEFDTVIHSEINTYLNQIKTRHIITVGIEVNELHLHGKYHNNQSLRCESICADRDMQLQTINWMKEQYDLYQSVAMA